MKRLMEKTVFCGLVTAWRLATVPTRRSPDAVKPTTDGVVRPPSAFGITVGSPPSRTAMHELVVPRSMPIVFAIRLSLLRFVRKLLRKSKPFCIRSKAVCPQPLSTTPRAYSGDGRRRARDLAPPLPAPARAAARRARLRHDGGCDRRGGDRRARRERLDERRRSGRGCARGSR